MAILYGFAARCWFGVVLLHKAKQGRWLCAVSTHKSLPHQRTLHWFTMKAPNRFRPSESLISSPRHGYCDVSFEGSFLKVFYSGQSNVRSGNSMTTFCVVNANMDWGEPGSQYCITKYGSSYPQIVSWLRVSSVWNYPIRWAYLKCSGV